MIHVDRSRVEKPAFLSSKECATLRADAEQHFRSATPDSRRFQFGLRQLRRHVDDALDALFHDKCAYCEQPVAKTVPMTKSAPRPGAPARRNFEHFRPKRGAADSTSEGESTPRHYWWLFYEWHNLYLACQTCNTNKRNQFPVAGGRAPLETAWQEIDRAEERLLLDPCVDAPSEVLLFAETGNVLPRPIEGAPRNAQGGRADFSIEILGLNRYDLVRARRRHATVFLEHLHSDRDAPDWADQVSARLAEEAPFSALHRQLFARWVLALDDPDPEHLRWLEETCPRLLAAERSRGARRPEPKRVARAQGVRTSRPKPPEVDDGLPDPTEMSLAIDADPDDEASAGLELEAVREPETAAVESPTVAPGGAEAEGGATARRHRRGPVEHAPSATIRRLTLRNFKAIREPEDLVIPEAPAKPVKEDAEDADDQAPETQLGWLSFLGENGAGKSSILQAIALALAGPRIKGDRTLKPPSRFIRRRDAADEAGKEIVGRVVLELSNLSQPLRLDITESRGFQFRDWEDSGVFVRAYGASRFPAPHRPEQAGGDAASPAEKTDRVEYENLFDPFKPLVDVKGWLRGLAHDETLCGAVRRALEDLLGLGPEPGAKESSKLRIDISPGGDLSVDDEPLENLSSGYQTLIALAADIMAGVPGRLSDMQDAGGIILLDEVGAHLHPAWKMVVVPRLRTAFPGMQFITTTHEPLCLRGHTEGEVAVVSRKLTALPHPERPETETVEAFEVRLATDLPSPKNLRVDQLLTSKHFGLDSTIDPELDASFRKYYQLLARREGDLKPKQKEELEDLRLKLRGQGILGYTRRDQLIYDTIDQYIADERKLERKAVAEQLTDKRKKERRKKVMDHVIDLWRFAKLEANAESGAGS